MANELTHFSDSWDDEPTVVEEWTRLPGGQIRPHQPGQWKRLDDDTLREVFSTDPKATHRDLPAIR